MYSVADYAVNILLCIVALGQFSNVQDAPVYSTAYNGAVVHCSQIKTDPGTLKLVLKGHLLVLKKTSLLKTDDLSI